MIQKRWPQTLLALVLITPAMSHASVEIRRTADDIPHIKADSWQALGVGIGHVQANDALCTLAEAFATYRGMRSWYWGADNKPAVDATFGRAKNSDLDLFFRSQTPDDVEQHYRQAQPADMHELVSGYVKGYNRYLAKAGKQHACVGQAWVKPITTQDIYRRLFASQLAGGDTHFIEAMAKAKPLAATGKQTSLAPVWATQNVGRQAGLGSNMLAFGSEATAEQQAVLFGNPHWYWGGADRFYQMHLTIPGKLNVAGVSFLGIPVIMIGFNENIAWSHTVSEARRFGLFDLTLDAANPEQYLVDGKAEAMQKREIRIPVMNQGKAGELVRVAYQTRYGPVVDLSEHHPALGWSQHKALAVRDINRDNFRIYRNFFRWNQARSLDEFISIQKEERAIPWVNTTAIGKNDGRVWYADIGAMPNAPDDLRQRCRTPVSDAFAQLAPTTPVLDGSRSDCNWRQDSQGVQAGALPLSAMPGLLRKDYVANMNDSHWLSNSKQPLEGFPLLLGGERTELSLRTRHGHHIAHVTSQAKAGSAAKLLAVLKQRTLNSAPYSATLFRQSLLQQACGQQPKADIAQACRVLKNWSGKAETGDRGALLWEAFWQTLTAKPENLVFNVPFDASHPLTTPRDPQAPQAAQLLAEAAGELKKRGIPLDAPLASYRHVLLANGKQGVFGGCHEFGYFAIACQPDSAQLDGSATANSYLQLVTFNGQGPQAHTLLAHGNDEAAIRGGSGSIAVQRYLRKQWLNFPFSEADIARDPSLRIQRLQP